MSTVFRLYNGASGKGRRLMAVNYNCIFDETESHLPFYTYHLRGDFIGGSLLYFTASASELLNTNNALYRVNKQYIVRVNLTNPNHFTIYVKVNNRRFD